MPAADTRQLQLQISASTELLIRNLKQADNAVGQFQRSTNGRLASIDARFAAVGALKSKLAGLDSHVGLGGLASAATGVTLVALAKRGLDYASSLQEVSQQLGVTSRDLQVYRYAASQVGIEQETIDKSLAKLTLTMGQAQAGASKPTAAFKALGISLESLRGKTAGDVIPRIADALAKIGDPAQRAALEVALFGKAGQALDTLLAGGSGQIDALTAAAQRLGLVLSSKEIADADQTADKLSEVKQVLEANVAHAVAENAGSILQLADAFEVLLGKISRFNPAYSGFLRILTKDGVGAAARSFFDLDNRFGADQKQASTDVGYVHLKVDQYRRAGREYNAAKADPSASSARITELGQAAVTAHVAAQGALREYKLATARQLAERKTLKSQVVTGDGQSSYAAGGGGAPKGKSAEQLAREAATAARKDRADQRRANDAVTRADLDVLSSRADLSNDPEQRLAIERQRIDLAKAGRDNDLEEQALDNRYIAANLARLKAANAQAAELDKQLAAQRVAQANEQTEYDRRRGAADDAIALDEIAASLTVIAKDRYAIERRILAAKQAEEREALERVKANVAGTFTPQEVTTASQELDRLPAKQAAEQDRQRHDQQGPLANYRDQLKGAVGNTNEALQGVAVHGLQSLEDGLLGVVNGTESVASAFKKMASSIVADLARIIIEKAILKAIGGSFGLPFADGGPVLHRAGGGPIFGPGGPRDDRIPAMLSNGEYVINAAATRAYLPLIEAINTRRLPRLADGGRVGQLPPLVASRLPDLSGRGRPQDRVHVTADIAVEPSPLFATQVRGIAVQTVGAAAEPIMAGAEGRTMRRLQRPSLPGAPG